MEYKMTLILIVLAVLLACTAAPQAPVPAPIPTPASTPLPTPTPEPTPKPTTPAPERQQGTEQEATAQQNEPTTFLPKDYVPARPDPEFDNFTWTLPTGASPLRLSLPAEIEDIFYSEKTGVGGFGLHAGGHIEGLDHVWIELKPGTPVRSWADGVVEDVRLSGMVDQGEYHITINYGQNLIGIHMEIETPYVKKGDRVKRGQEVGLGMSFDPEQSSAELALADLGRTDGVKYYGGKGVFVSPYDYLEDSEKKKLVEAYQKYVIEPYQKEASREGIF
jgi:murein DD-endopeptidase MepM/ murein hydrolase activator NlpD